MTRDSDNFRLHCGVHFFEKAGAPVGRRRRIAGVITTDALDRQGEVIDQDGLDFTEFLEHGFFNENHAKSTPAILGWPDKTSLRRFRPGEKLPTGKIARSNGHYVEGWLLENDPLADAIWRKGKALQDAGADRGLGYSIEGKTIARDPIQTNRVTRALVRHVAVTGSPVNTESEFLAKAFFSSDVHRALTTESGAPLIHEHIEGAELDDLTTDIVRRLGVGRDLAQRTAGWILKAKSGGNAAMYMGNKMMKGEGKDHYAMRMAFKKAHPAEEYTSTFGGFVKANAPADGDEPDDDDVEKAISLYKGGARALTSDDLEKALGTLVGALERTQPRGRRDELLAKAQASGSLSVAEADELARLVKANDAGGFTSSLVGGLGAGEALAKSLADGSPLNTVLSNLSGALAKIGERLEKGEGDAHEFNTALADALVAQGELLKSVQADLATLRGELSAMSGTPARPPQAAGPGWPAGVVPTPAQLAALQRPGATALNKGDGAPQQPSFPQGKDPRVLDALELMFRKSLAGQYGHGGGLAKCGQDIQKALAAYEGEHVITAEMAAEVMAFVTQPQQQPAAA